MTERTAANQLEVDFGERFCPFEKGLLTLRGKIGIYSPPFLLKSVGTGEVQLTPLDEDRTVYDLKVLVEFGDPESVNANFGCEVFLSNQEYVSNNSWKNDPLGEGSAFFEEWRLGGNQVIRVEINTRTLDILSSLELAFISNP